MVELYAFILSLGFNVSYFVFSYAVIMFMLIVGCVLVCIDGRPYDCETGK